MDVKVIPGTKGFMASSCGVILDPSGRVRNQYINGDGYKTASVLTEKGKWQTFGVQRLVALAHLPLPENYEELVVNHRDHDLTNNSASNLEWTTDLLNNIHSALFKGTKQNPSIIARSPSGKHEFISNIQTAAKRFHCDESLIWDLIRDNGELNGWSFKHNGVREKIPEDLWREKMNGLRKDGKLAPREIQVLNIQDQTVEIFPTIREAAKHYQTSPRHVHKSISTSEKKRLFKEKYLIVDKGQSFPSLSQDELEELLRPTGKEVLAYNFENGEFFHYESAASFIRESKLSKKTVTVSLKQNKIRSVRGWIYLYLSSENIDRLGIASGLPDPT